jgi:anthranilate phosphoribosyltransferase
LRLDDSDPLDLALAAKGIGPKGLKPLGGDVIESIVIEMSCGQRDVLSAVVMMGFRVLERNSVELEALMMAYQRMKSKIRAPLQFLFELGHRSASSAVEGWVQKLANREDLSSEECQGVVRYLLDPQGEGVFKAALLQGLRVKRETDLENASLCSALMAQARHWQWDGELLVDLSQPYDGMTRSEDLSLELVALLSLINVPCVSHGVRGLGPKFGTSIVSRFSEKAELTIDRAMEGLSAFGVAILDQSNHFPELHELLPLRNEMRKRPFLATMEKMLMPIRANRNILVTGYVHSAYRDSIPEMVRAVGYYEQLLLVKGREGSTFLDPLKKQEAFGLTNQSVTSITLPEWGESVTSKSKHEEWWSVEGHDLQASLLRSAGVIASFALGDEGESNRMALMKSLCVDGRLNQRLLEIKEHYDSSVL